MTKIHNFKDSLALGEMGEEIILDYLQKSPTIQRIIDVRDEKLYQKMDVDLVVVTKDEQELKVEIKTDSYKSGNIFYEWTSAVETASVGCMEKTQADYLFYYFINLQTMYIFDMAAYRDWFNENKEMFDFLGYQKRVKNSQWNGGTYETLGYAFPITILDDLNPKWIRKVYVHA